MSDVLSRPAAAPRLLVVDDDPLVVELMREVLGREGYRVLTARSPDEAVAVMTARDVDLVLTDIRMPGPRSGLDLLHELRHLYPSVPVLLVTGSSKGEASLTEALDGGAAGFLVKPFTPAQLCAKVEQTLEHKQHAEADMRDRIVRPTIATALANAIEVKDAGMEGHVERLGEIALAIGRRLGLAQHDLESLELGAVLHDVGKIGIPDAILLKPRTLDPDEREVMKAHTVIGDQMLRHLDLEEIRPIVRHHHERWDGAGYPDGLSGEAIPLLARIVSVADSIEAMSAHRVYRTPITPEEVRAELEAGSGGQWDPGVVDVALRLMDEGEIAFDAHGPLARASTVAPLLGTDSGSADRLLGSGGELLRALTAHSGVGVYIADPKGTCIYVNEGWCELSGLTAEQALGDGWLAALHPDDEARMAAEWEAAAAEGRDSSAEYRFLRPDGTVAWITRFASALRDDEGRVRGWVGTCLDTTAHRRAQEEIAEANERFKVAFQNAPIGMALVKPDGTWLQVNDALCALLGYTPEELAGRTFFEVTHPDDVAFSAERRRTQIAADPEGVPSRLEKRYIRADGEIIWAAVSSAIVRGLDGEALYSVAQIEDITERVRAQRALTEAEERFRRAFEDAPIGMALADLDGRWLSVNQALATLTGYSREQLHGMNFREVTHPDDLDADVALMERVLANEISSYQLEKRYIRADGEPVWVKLSVSFVRDADGTPLHFIAQVEDISERKRAEERLRHLADHDELTGLLNRRRFAEELARERERLRRQPGRLAGLLLLDVDRFKRINDTLGHQAGDEVLRALAQTLRGRLRATDVVARLGGDEFAALVVDLDSPAEARQVAESIGEAIRTQAIVTRSGASYATVSIGVAVLDGDTVEREHDLLIAADNAMYRAKRAGRDRISHAA